MSSAYQTPEGYMFASFVAINPSAPSRVFTDHFTDHFQKKKKCLARSSRVGDFLKDTQTPRARSCTALQSSSAAPAKRDNKRHPKVTL